MSTKLEIVRDEAGFRAIKTSWEALLSTSKSDAIFLSWAWLFFWRRSYARTYKIMIFLIYEDNQLIGIAPLYILPKKFGFFVYQELRLMGDQISDQRYTSRKLDFISRKGSEQIVNQAVWRYLLASREWDFTFFYGVPADSPNLPYWRKFFAFKFFREEKTSFSCVNLSDWRQYLLSLKPRMRTKIKSLLSVFNDCKEKGRIKFIISATVEELDQQLDSFMALHEKRWNRLGKVGLFGVPGSKEFIFTVSRELLANGQLMFCHLKYNEEHIAHQFCLFYDNAVYLINEAYDPDFADFDAGNMLRAKLFYYLTNAGVTAYDFLNNYSQHKRRWGAIKDKQYLIKLGKKNFRNSIYFYYHHIRRSSKNLLSKYLPSRISPWP